MALRERLTARSSGWEPVDTPSVDVIDDDGIGGTHPPHSRKPTRGEEARAEGALHATRVTHATGKMHTTQEALPEHSEATGSAHEPSDTHSVDTPAASATNGGGGGATAQPTVGSRAERSPCARRARSTRCRRRCTGYQGLHASRESRSARSQATRPRRAPPREAAALLLSADGRRERERRHTKRERTQGTERQRRK